MNFWVLKSKIKWLEWKKTVHISRCVDGHPPVWVSHLQQLSALLRQQADGLGIVLDGLLQDQVLLQQLQRARLVLVGDEHDSSQVSLAKIVNELPKMLSLDVAKAGNNQKTLFLVCSSHLEIVLKGHFVKGVDI